MRYIGITSIFGKRGNGWRKDVLWRWMSYKSYEDSIDGAGRGPMKELARQYGSLIQEVEDVRMEIERLHV